MLHGSIAAHHQERKGRGEQCGSRFPNGRAARLRVWVLEPPGHPRELLPFGANPPAGPDWAHAWSASPTNHRRGGGPPIRRL